MLKSIAQRTLKFVLNPPPPVLRVGHPLLRSKARPINATELFGSSSPLPTILTEMREVFNSKLTPVIGLAAPQIGHGYRVIAFQIKDKQLLRENDLENEVELTFLLNPEIVGSSGTSTTSYEFCESIPSYSALVKRSNQIRIKALDLEGKLVERKFTGILARILQHEIDHLDGVCYVDKMEKATLRHDKYVDKYEVHV